MTAAQVRPVELGHARPRVDARAKVLGAAPYAYEHPQEQALYGHLVTSTVARGRVRALETAQARAQDGVLAVIGHEDAHRLVDTGDDEMAVLQGPDIAFLGQIVAIVVAEDPETAREAARLVDVAYDVQEPEAVLASDDDVYRPDQVNPAYESDTSEGDPDTALAEAPVVVDHTYRTPPQFHVAMEPHQSVARWDGDHLTVWDSTQGPHTVAQTLAPLLALDPGQVRVVAPYVGGGFGSKGLPHAHVVAAVLAARHLPGRPVKLPLTRQQAFPLGGHRTPTIQRVALGADADGRLSSIVHEVVEHSSRVKEFAEQTAVATRMMYASPARRTAHRLDALDVPVPTWMRAPGEAPGMYALEVAMDELAVAAGLDPVEVRVRNEPVDDPATGKPFSDRRYVECLREATRRLGWTSGVAPRRRREGRWLVGQGLGGSTYPVNVMPPSEAEIEVLDAGRLAVRIGAVDIGTGAWTVLQQIAADALEVGHEDVDLEIGDSRFPFASVAGGSSGTTMWGSAIVAAARELREQHGARPTRGTIVRASGPEDPTDEDHALHSFGAHAVEVRVDADTGEVRVPRTVSVFSVGRVANPVTARSQLLGGVTMGISAALFEHGVIDPTGRVPNHDLAQYHVASHADVGSIEVDWLAETDEHANAMGLRGLGEIGIVGAAAAVVNAAFDATGVRVREVPLSPDLFCG